MKASTTLRLHFMVFLWGFTGVIGKLISVESLPLVWHRLFIAVLCIGAYMWYKKIPAKIHKKQLISLLLMGALIGIHWFLFFWAIKVSNVSIALCTLSSGALFSALLEPLFFKRKIDFFEIIISTVVIICMLLLFKIETRYSFGISLGLLCTLFSVLFSLFNTKFIRMHQGSVTCFSFFELIGAFITINILLLFNNDFDSLFSINQNDLIWLIILGSLLTAYPTIQSIELLKKISPYTLLLTINLEPVYGIIIAYFVFPDSEQMKPAFYFVVLLLVSAIAFNEYLKHQVEKNEWRKKSL